MPEPCGASCPASPWHVLFVCSNDTQVRTFAPLMAELKRMGVSCQATAVSLDRYYRQGATAAASRQLDKWQALELPRPQALAENFYGRNVFRVWADVAGNAVPQIKRLLAGRPSAVVLGNDRGLIEKTFIAQARRQAVPTLLVQDGFIRQSESQEWGRLLKRWAGKPLHLLGLGHLAASRYGEGGCDMLAVYGPKAVELFAGRGNRPEAIRVVGQVRYDELLGRRGQPRARPGGALYLTSNILHGLRDRQGHGKQLQEIDSIRGALRSVFGEGCQLTVKIHPRERLADYGWLAGKVQVVREADVFELIRDAAWVLTSISTTWLEAALLGRPCVITNIHFPGTTVANYVIRNDGIRCARSKQELENLLAHLSSDPQALGDYLSRLERAATDEVLFLEGETAASRLARALLELLGGNGVARSMHCG